MIIRLAWTTVVLTLCASGAIAQTTKGNLTDPIEILKRADAASKAVKVAQYEAKAFALDENGQPELVGEGKVVIQGFARHGPAKFHVLGKFRMAGPEDPHHVRTGYSEDQQHLTIGSDAKKHYLLDWKTRKAYVDIDPNVTGRRGQLVPTVMMSEYVHPTPFSDELGGSDHKLVGTTKIGDEECYEIVVHASVGGWQHARVSQKAHWFFSTRDFLPRRVDRFFTRDGRPARGTRLVITSLTVDRPDAEKLFRFRLPDGFEQIDDFAP